MKIVSNDKLIERNSKIGNFTSLASVVVLGVGMFFSFKDKDGSYMALTFTALILGFLLFQVGNYFLNRFGKPPRPDQRITQAVKGLEDRYTLYHYSSAVSHLLVGPGGIYCLLPYNQPGSIVYQADKKRWKQTGGNFFLKTFGGESLGRPEVESGYAVSDITKYLQKKGVDLGKVQPEAVIVFTNDKASVSTEGYSGQAVSGEKLKEFIRKKSKNNTLPPELIDSINQMLSPK